MASGQGRDPRRETRAGPAGAGQVRREQGQGQVPVPEVLGGQGTRCARAGPALPAPAGRQIPLRLQICPESVLHGPRWASARHGARFGPCHTGSSRCFLLSPFPFCSCFPGLPGRAGEVCGGPAACSLGAVGFVLSLLCGWLLLGYQNGLEKPVWGREARRSLLLLLFWCLSCCHFRSHSCSENIVAGTQQDDLLAVIHGEASQTGFLPPLMIKLIKFKTQQKRAQIRLLDALTHGHRMRKKCIYSFKKYLSIPALCEGLSSRTVFIATVSNVNILQNWGRGIFFLFSFISC